MTGVAEVLLAALPGCLIGGVALVAARRMARRQQVAVEHAREELLVMLSQQQTEYLDGLEEVSRGVVFLEESARHTEDALHDRLTPSLRSKAMQLLRSGLAADAAAASLGMPRSDVRLIAAVSRTLSPQ